MIPNTKLCRGDCKNETVFHSAYYTTEPSCAIKLSWIPCLNLSVFWIFTHHGMFNYFLHELVTYHKETSSPFLCLPLIRLTLINLFFCLPEEVPPLFPCGRDLIRLTKNLDWPKDVLQTWIGCISEIRRKWIDFDGDIA